MIDLKNRSELTVINIVSAVLAAFLFASPWVMGFSDLQPASWNAWVCGLAVCVIALAAVTQLKEWEEWVNGILGLWILIAPWALGFANVANALWTHVGVGLAVTALAAIELWLIHSGPPARTA
jgi:hypothetical protein